MVFRPDAVSVAVHGLSVTSCQYMSALDDKGAGTLEAVVIGGDIE